MRSCIRCLIEKPDTEFYIDKRRPHHPTKVCKQCIRLASKQRYDANKELIADQGRWYREENKEKIKERVSEYYKANKDKFKARAQHYYQNNKEDIRKYQRQWEKDNKNFQQNKKEYAKRNRLAHNTRNKRYRQKNFIRLKRRHFTRLKEDPIYLLRYKIRLRVLKALHGCRYTKKSKTYELLGCEYSHFLEYMGSKPDGDYHIDHICPCAQAQNEEELIKLQNYKNFRWLPAEENLKKSCCKTPEAEQKCWELLNRDWIGD